MFKKIGLLVISTYILYGMEPSAVQGDAYQSTTIEKFSDLKEAIETGNKGLIKEFCDLIDINKGVPCLANDLPLHWILFQAPLSIIPEGLSRGYRFELADHLIILGADVNAFDAYGLTALHKAADRGEKDTIQFLRAHQAAVELYSPKGWTVLSYAIAKGHLDIVAYLLEHTPISISFVGKHYQGDYAFALKLKKQASNKVKEKRPKEEMEHMQKALLCRTEIAKSLKRFLIGTPNRYQMFSRKCQVCKHSFKKKDLQMISECGGGFVHAACM